LELIDSNKFDVFSRNFPEKQFNSLINNYRGFFNNERLKRELQVLYSDKLIFGNSPTVREMTEFIYKNDIITDVPEIYKLFFARPVYNEKLHSLIVWSKVPLFFPWAKKPQLTQAFSHLFSPWAKSHSLFNLLWYIFILS
jgi:hypothetical protein